MKGNREIGNENKLLCLHLGVKVLPVFIRLEKSMKHVYLDNVYLVKVRVANFKIYNFVDSKFILISLFKSNVNSTF